MAVGLRLCWCLLFAFAIISSARTTISFSVSGEEVVEWEMQGRYLKVNLDDYSGASANNGHNPPPTSVKKSPSHH